MILPPWIVGVILGVYGLLILYALCVPPRQPDPQRGVGIGCLWIVLAALVGVGALLAVGVALHISWLVNTISAVCLYPLFIGVIGLIKSGLDWLRNRK